MTIKGKEVKLDEKLLARLVTDPKMFTLYKRLADAGGMAWCGIKDAAHLEQVVQSQRKDVLRSKIASGKEQLKALNKQNIKDVLNNALNAEERKDARGHISFYYDEDASDWAFNAVIKHGRLSKKGGNSGSKKKGVKRSKGVWAPLAKSHSNSNRYAYFLLLSLGVEVDKCPDGRAPLYRDDNLKVLLAETKETRRAINFRELPDADKDSDTKEKQHWVADLNVALAKHENETIEKWL